MRSRFALASTPRLLLYQIKKKFVRKYYRVLRISRVNQVRGTTALRIPANATQKEYMNSFLTTFFIFRRGSATSRSYAIFMGWII